MTGEQFSETFVRIPLFIFMLFIILGSYAVLATLVQAIQSRKVGTIVKILAIEMVALFVEVVFLYREFVDSLVPWFAQYASEDFSLGIFGTLFIASLAWVGIRGLSWFLFANHGTPTIMAVIQATGIQRVENQPANQNLTVDYTQGFTHKIKEEMFWVQKKGDELVAAFILPPLQVMAATVNFCTLLVIATHLFQLPFKNVSEVLESKELLQRIPKKVTAKPEERYV